MVQEKKLIPSPLNPDWMIPEGWENILGTSIEYHLGGINLRLMQAQLNLHLKAADPATTHVHEHHQLLYYQRGSGKMVAGKKSYDVERGSIFVLPAGCRHSLHAADTAVCVALDFSLSTAAQAMEGGLPVHSEAAVLLSLTLTRQARPFQLRSIDQAHIDQTIGEIVKESAGREPGYGTMIQALLLRLVALCLRGTRRASGFGEHFRHTAWRHRLLAERALALIAAESFRQPELTLQEAARRCGASYNHFNRVLKFETGRTFHQHLLRSRLEHAHDLLSAGKLNCSEAALESGFTDSNYFARAFRKSYGFPPSELARGLKGE